jgi:hypothetical protein
MSIIRSAGAGIGLISPEKLRVYDAVAADGGWLTSAAIATSASVATRTARAVAVRFVKAGVFEVTSATWPMRYRLVSGGAKGDLARAINEAREVFGEPAKGRDHGKKRGRR